MTRHRWHRWSTLDGIERDPPALDPSELRELERRYLIERSGDGQWASVLDDHGLVVATLIRLPTNKQPPREMIDHA